MAKEQWREIDGWSGRFEVSDRGRVRFTKDGRILPQTLVKGGWLTVYLFHNSKRRWPRVHRLVAEAFLANPDGLPCVEHRDGDRTNNSVSNLRWSAWLQQGKGATEARDDEQFRPVPGIDSLECSREGRFRYKGRSKALRTGSQVNGKPASVRVVLTIDGRQQSYQASRLVAQTWLSGYTDDCYITYRDGDCHNICAGNLTLADRDDFNDYIQRNSGFEADTLDERKRKLQLVIDQAGMTLHYLKTLDLEPVHQHVKEYLYPTLMQWSIKTLQFGEYKSQELAADAIARMYECLMAGMALYNYERYCKKLMHNYKKTGTFGFTGQVPRQIEIIVEQLNLNRLWERYKVTHQKRK